VILLVITSALFSLGLYGVLVRRDVISILASIEVMLAGPLVLLVAAASSGGPTGGPLAQSAGLIVIVIAAAEAAIGLALLVAVARSTRTTRIDELQEVRG